MGEFRLHSRLINATRRFYRTTALMILDAKVAQNDVLCVLPAFFLPRIVVQVLTNNNAKRGSIVQVMG